MAFNTGKGFLNSIVFFNVILMMFMKVLDFIYGNILISKVTDQCSTETCDRILIVEGSF